MTTEHPQALPRHSEAAGLSVTQSNSNSTRCCTARAACMAEIHDAQSSPGPGPPRSRLRPRPLQFTRFTIMSHTCPPLIIPYHTPAHHAAATCGTSPLRSRPLPGSVTHAISNTPTQPARSGRPLPPASGCFRTLPHAFARLLVHAPCTTTPLTSAIPAHTCRMHAVARTPGACLTAGHRGVRAGNAVTCSDARDATPHACMPASAAVPNPAPHHPIHGITTRETVPPRRLRRNWRSRLHSPGPPPAACARPVPSAGSHRVLPPSSEPAFPSGRASRIGPCCGGYCGDGVARARASADRAACVMEGAGVGLGGRSHALVLQRLMVAWAPFVSELACARRGSERRHAVGLPHARNRMVWPQNWRRATFVQLASLSHRAVGCVSLAVCQTCSSAVRRHRTQGATDPGGLMPCNGYLKASRHVDDECVSWHALCASSRVRGLGRPCHWPAMSDHGVPDEHRGLLWTSCVRQRRHGSGACKLQGAVLISGQS